LAHPPDRLDRRHEGLELAKSRRSFTQIQDRNADPALRRGVVTEGEIVGGVHGLYRGYAQGLSDKIALQGCNCLLNM
jgi:hypothetical protein